MATVTVSAKYRITIPASLRRRLGIRPGDKLEASAEGGHIVLVPRSGVAGGDPDGLPTSDIRCRDDA